MKKLFLFGAIAFGLMSFSEFEEGTDCFTLANEITDEMHLRAPTLSQEALDDSWDRFFTTCSSQSGQLLDEVKVK
ncbi:hypothetical protein [uncultured Nonlabens sp.]|uniref:hypothetical protein n=1 Tax=uncultured Nonlabens sp. TaxID=859306 RepID=UPI00262E4435|nr:hypothetical protein [uncultured Nonlabens sp.]